MNAKTFVNQLPEPIKNQIIAESNAPVLETEENLIDAITENPEGFEALIKKYAPEWAEEMWGEPENFARSIYETPDTWGNETEYADEPSMEKTVASLGEAGIDADFGDCNEWKLVENYGTFAIYTLLRVRKDRFGVFSAKEDREGFYELIDGAETLDEAREEIEERLGNNGHANFEGHHYIFDTQAVLTNGVFAGWFGDAEDGEEYTTQYAATGYRDDGAEYRIFFEFSVVKGEEPEDESEYTWNDEHVSGVSPL